MGSNGYLIDDGDRTETIEIPGTDGETVTLKRHATYEDQLAVEGAMPPGVDRYEFVRAYVPARTMVMLESWSLKERDGSPLPINEEVLGQRLTREVAEFIVIEARKRYDGEEDSEAPLDSPSAQP